MQWTNWDCSFWFNATKHEIPSFISYRRDTCWWGTECSIDAMLYHMTRTLFRANTYTHTIASNSMLWTHATYVRDRKWANDMYVRLVQGVVVVVVVVAQPNPRMFCASWTKQLIFRWWQMFAILNWNWTGCAIMPCASSSILRVLC